MNAAPHSLNLADSDGARERLMEAAAQLFALRGFEVTTVRDIVTAAGTNLNAINYYFVGKRGLYQAVMLRELERARSFTAELPHAAANDPIEQRLESLVLRLLTYFVSQHSRLPRLAALEVVNPSVAFEDVKASIQHEESRELQDIVAVVLGPRASAETIDDGIRCVYSQCIYFMFMGETLQRAGSLVFANAAAVRRLATQITTFSLGGLRALASASASLSPDPRNGVLR
jgi:TetR/AcrR family transcriptional regulator, regulator of cefoperazone and chloramphenicol sensitivity